jgi:hypothetical protein
METSKIKGAELALMERLKFLTTSTDSPSEEVKKEAVLIMATNPWLMKAVRATVEFAATDPLNVLEERPKKSFQERLEELAIERGFKTPNY